MPSQFVSVRGKSGIVVYGEISVTNNNLKIGQKIKRFCEIGRVKTILKHPPREKVNYHSMKMLHIELLKNNAPFTYAQIWKDKEKRDRFLKDPTIYLFK